jgi:hypothetical protein
MKNIITILLLSLLSVNASAAEKMAKGSVLKEDSMVFTIPEATNMATYMANLEEKIKKYDLIIETYKDLIEVKDEKYKIQEEYLMIKENIIIKYKEIEALDKKRISDLEKRDSMRKIETIGAFVAGVGLTAAIVIATK